MEKSNKMATDIYSVGYDEDYATLEVQFRNGAVYEYYDFPAEVHKNFVTAESPKDFFTKAIRDIYPFSRVG